MFFLQKNKWGEGGEEEEVAELRCPPALLDSGIRTERDSGEGGHPCAACPSERGADGLHTRTVRRYAGDGADDEPLWSPRIAIDVRMDRNAIDCRIVQHCPNELRLSNCNLAFELLLRVGAKLAGWIFADVMHCEHYTACCGGNYATTQPKV